MIRRMEKFEKMSHRFFFSKEKKIEANKNTLYVKLCIDRDSSNGCDAVGNFSTHRPRKYKKNILSSLTMFRNNNVVLFLNWQVRIHPTIKYIYYKVVYQ